MGFRIVAVGLLFAISGSHSAIHAQDAGIEFFEKKVRPLLVEHCFECHAVGAKKVRGQLLLDSRQGVREGGVSGPAIEPGHPDKSLLIKAVLYHDPDMKMPPKGKLSAAMIADLETWVKVGAPDPRDRPAIGKAGKTWDEAVRERRAWWSLQPVKKPVAPTPKIANWSNDPIDRFLLAAMEGRGLTPAKDADPRTLIRRLSLVLTGLPPTGAEIEEFAKAWNTSAKPQAMVEQLVDRLLASPHFGERWARHWMDVVRFTETHGNEWNYEVHHAWRYRDYLIRAFNDDVPFDQFVREHIAGDLLAKPRWGPTRPLTGLGSPESRFNESVIGTAFYRFGEVNHDDCIDLRSIGYDIADNQIDTFSKAFQAMTVACARCHDHKLDAISTRDYHGILGVLRSSRQVAHTIDAPEVNAEILQKMRDTQAAIRAELVAAWLKEMEPARLQKAMEKMTDDKLPMENPLSFWRMIARLQEKEKKTFFEAWQIARDKYQKEEDARKKQEIEVLADFRGPDVWFRSGWQLSGMGLRGGFSGEFAVAPQGERAITAIFPDGLYTNGLSEKLNGALRSPILKTKRKYISFHVRGDGASAVRLVSNNCQLNYRNFRYLTKNAWHWITFPLPDDLDSLRVYAEVMTKFDNPKFPDQLGSLGGGKDYRVPWEQAAADPRSHFGITHVVLHDQPAPPQLPLKHLRYLFFLAAKPPESPAELASRYQEVLRGAIASWGVHAEQDPYAFWLDSFVQKGILSNRANLTPKLEKLIAEYRQLDAELALPRIVPGLADGGPGFDQAIFARGDCMKPGEKTPRRYVAVLSPQPFFLPLPPGRGAGGEGSGRLEMANAIAAPDNPLTARVMVNRLWHHLFGAGLVRTVDDFGHVGELPSHPELLDYLADRFMHPSPSGRGDGGEGPGWSMKKLIRSIVLTRAFQLSHTPSAAAVEADPTNRLLSHYPARRMEAEAIRDALLATSGRLDRTLYGPSIPAYREKEYADRRLFKGPLDGNGRRSIYTKVTLMEAPKFLEVFNFPGGKVCQGRRDVTNTPAQALALLNDPFVVQQADGWAKRLVERKGDTVEARIDAMFRAALGREPRKEERERFVKFVSQVVTANNVRENGVLASAAVWCEVAHVMFNLQEFVTIP